MSNYLLDDSSNILTNDSGTDRLISGLTGGATLSVSAGSFTFSGMAVSLVERAAMVLRLRYRKF